MGASQFVVDVHDFESQVIARSRATSVLVDFWAPWCGPCRVLGPLLEALADEYAGAFVLAKVNTDDHQAAAMRYQVRGIPDVKLFRDGAAIDGFVGALPEPQVRAFLRQHFPSEAEGLLAEGLQALERGDHQAARAALLRAVALDAGLDAGHYGLARAALMARDFDAVAGHIEATSPHSDEREAGEHLLDAVALVSAAEAVGSVEAVRARIDADPDDVEAYYALGGHEIAAGRYRSALEAYLQVAERQRKWRDEAARKAMLTVFSILGVRHPISDEFRQKLVFIY